MGQAEKSANFDRGFFCAVAVLLKEGHEQQARQLFRLGGNPLNADDVDIEVFRQYGLLVENRDGHLVRKEFYV